jgi:hypothetical protein
MLTWDFSWRHEMKEDALQKGFPVPEQAVFRERVHRKDIEALDPELSLRFPNSGQLILGVLGNKIFLKSRLINIAALPQAQLNLRSLTAYSTHPLFKHLPSLLLMN